MFIAAATNRMLSQFGRAEFNIACNHSSASPPVRTAMKTREIGVISIPPGRGVNAIMPTCRLLIHPELQLGDQRRPLIQPEL